MKRFFFTVLVFSVIAGFDGASADPLPSAGAALPAPPAVLNPTPVPTNAPTSAPTLTPSPELKLSGKWGIGSGFINYRSNVYTCLSVRSWVSDGACLDFLGYYSGYSNDGTDFVGNAAQQPTYYLGGGLGLKCNLAEVRKNLFLQLQTEVTYIHYHYQYSSAYESYTSDSETWGLFTGISFEYFLPFFDSLSIESNIGYLQGFDDDNTLYHYNPLYYSGSLTAQRSGAGTDGRLLVNGGSIGGIAVHFYF